MTTAIEQSPEVLDAAVLDRLATWMEDYDVNPPYALNRATHVELRDIAERLAIEAYGKEYDAECIASESE